MIAIQQVASLIVLPRILQKGTPADSIVGGISAGCIFAYFLTVFLETCVAGPRAAFSQDPRHLMPFDRKRMSKFEKVYEGKDLPRADYFRFCGVPSYRFRARCLNIPCPRLEKDRRIGYQSDEFINSRLSNYMLAADVYNLPDAEHIPMDLTHSWDIARRIRVIA